jgi:uncharacterized protein
MHELGQGVPRDDRAAALYYEAAASRGDAFAQNSLGYLYQYGMGVVRDESRALRLYQAAARQGYAQAWYNLGYVHAFGIGVDADAAQADAYFRKAAEAGVAQASLQLAAKSTGFIRDVIDAGRLLPVAAEPADDTTASLAATSNGAGTS